MLKLCAVNLDQRIRIAEKRLSYGLDQTCFTRSSRTQEQQSTHRPVWLIHAGEKGLVKIGHRSDRAILTDNSSAQFFIKVGGPSTLYLWIKNQSGLFRASLIDHL